jgi:hypothetical protein
MASVERWTESLNDSEEDLDVDVQHVQLDEAVLGMHYRKVPNATGRWNWKCLIAGCPSVRTFSRKEYFNQHLLEKHSDLKLEVTASEPSGRKRGVGG